MTTTSWTPQFLVDGAWCGNAQRFATKAEASDSAAARFRVWTIPTDHRAIETSDPVNYTRLDGRDISTTTQET